MRQAGNVWLKIADYGISQVSTGLTMRVANSPIGTPGFMAPEVFENPGQEVSSEKVKEMLCPYYSRNPSDVANDPWEFVSLLFKESKWHS